jgi:hypothetical protein
MQRQAVEAVQPQPPSYGLIAALQTLVRDDVTLIAGARWLPEQCGSSGRQRVECTGSTIARQAPANPEIQEADPFVVWAAFECSPFGWQSIDYIGRAERQLAATQSFEVANELWTGRLAIDDASPTAFLTDDSTAIVLGSGALTPLEALGCLEMGLATCGKGRRGLIHCTPALLAVWVGSLAVQKAGGQFVSPLGNIVVADAGYDGSGPGGTAAGAAQWAYATDLISVRLGAVDTMPANLESTEDWVMAMRTTDNTVIAYAQRPAIYQWDACCHVAVEVDLPVCVIAGS